MGPRVINQNAPHHLRGDAEEVSAVLPRRGALIDEPQIGFVDETGSLQGVIRAFSLQVLAGELAQFFVNERHQAGGCFGIALAPIDQHLGDLLSGRRRYHAMCFQEEPGAPNLSGEYRDWLSLNSAKHRAARLELHP